MRLLSTMQGRVAFLRAELQITDAQAKLWETFAGSLRDNARRLKDSGGMMPGIQGPALLGQLDAQEKMLSTRLEGVKAMKASLTPLHEALTEEQRKAADELLAPHMGLMGKDMMQGGTTQGGSMPMQNNSE